jgi:predicted CoA-binding protein
MTSPDATTLPDAPDDWRRHLVETTSGVRALLARTRRIAVLGIKTPETGAPAYYVPEYAQQSGYEVVPVPVYFPEVTTLLGQPVYRTLAAVPGPIDMVNVFRRPRDIPAHLDDILAARPKSVWFQLGIRHDEVAEQLARAGIDVVQDRCLLVELRYMGR